MGESIVRAASTSALRNYLKTLRRRQTVIVMKIRQLESYMGRCRRLRSFWRWIPDPSVRGSRIPGRCSLVRSDDVNRITFPRPCRPVGSDRPGGGIWHPGRSRAAARAASTRQPVPSPGCAPSLVCRCPGTRAARPLLVPTWPRRSPPAASGYGVHRCRVNPACHLRSSNARERNSGGTVAGCALVVSHQARGPVPHCAAP